MKLTRRTFLKTVAAASGAAWLDPAQRRASALPFQKRALPPPGESGIDHVVVVMMENRSFDHQLGWLPNADGRQAGLIRLDLRPDNSSRELQLRELQGMNEPGSAVAHLLSSSGSESPASR